MSQCLDLQKEDGNKKEYILLLLILALSGDKMAGVSVLKELSMR